MSRAGIGDSRKQRYSKRVASGAMSVVKDGYICVCGHKKFFLKTRGVFCTRCGRRVKKPSE